MLFNENHTLRVPPYRRSVAISAPNYMDTALYGNRVLRIPRYRRAIGIQREREYCLIVGFTICVLYLIFNKRFGKKEYIKFTCS